MTATPRYRARRGSPRSSGGRSGSPTLAADILGAGRLAVDLTLLVTDVVETMHHNIARHPGILGRATFAPTRGITGLVYRSVKGVTRLAGAGIDAALAPHATVGAEGVSSPHRAAIVAALNGVLGDRLEASGNPLAIDMRLCHAGQPLRLTAQDLAAAFPRAEPRVIVMVHGLCMSDVGAGRRAHDHGRALSRDLAADVVHLRYNSGRHISTNGAEFANLLEQLVACWPRRSVDLVLVGHSMGGLVIRSALASTAAQDHRWQRRLRGIVFLGTPHHGAPMERAGQGADLLLAASPYTAAFTRLGRLRSAGITDLRHGVILDCDWQGGDRFLDRGDARTPQPLPATVPCFAVAGSLTRVATGRRPRGDGLVPIDSALGHHVNPALDLAIPSSRQWVAYGTGHLALLRSRIVQRKLREWLGDALHRSPPPA